MSPASSIFIFGDGKGFNLSAVNSAVATFVRFWTKAENLGGPSPYHEPSRFSDKTATESQNVALGDGGRRAVCRTYAAARDFQSRTFEWRQLTTVT